MSFDLQWDHQFCLACDKQTDGATYCSESCRLADYEKTSSTPSSGASSPALTAPSYPWTLPTPTASSTKFYLSPAYDFGNPRPYGTTPTTRQLPSVQQRRQERSRSLVPPHVLSPSSSHNSLASLQSTSSTASSTNAEASQLSEKAQKELRAYASSFDHVRLQRRRSY